MFRTTPFARRSRALLMLGLAGVLGATGSAGFGQKGDNGSPLLPDKTMTPGDTLAVTTKDVCKPGYSKLVRDVPQAVKNQVYKNYGITSRKPGEYEIDHLISLELGGSNSVKNLWPQSYVTTPWNAHVKDKLENELHKEVCDGKIPLAQAQHDIATDWIAAYKKYFHTDAPLSAGKTPRKSSGQTDRQPSGKPTAESRVWVNLGSGLFFRYTSRYYGNTKKGMYMTEAEALSKGYKPAK